MASIPSAAAAAAAIDVEEVKSILMAVGLPAGYYTALETMGLVSVVMVMSESGGALGHDPPHYLTLQAVVDRACNLNTMVGPAAWPTDTDPSYGAVMMKMTAFCRMCKRAMPAAEARMLQAIGAHLAPSIPTTVELEAEAKRKRDEEQLKNQRAYCKG